MGLGNWISDKKDSLVQSLALGWIKGKVEGMRTSGSKTMQMLDGNQGLVLAVGFVAAGLYALITGHDVGPMLEGLLRAIGWTDGDVIAKARATATTLVPLLWALWTAIAKLYEWRKQRKAGAKVVELGSQVGAVKAALAAGAIVDARTGTPMSDTAAPAKAVPLEVAAKGPVVVVEALK